MSASVTSRPGLALVALPDLLPVAVAAFSVPTVVLLLLGQFHPWLVIPAGLICAGVMVWRLGVQDQTVARSAVTWSVLALGLALASLAGNAYLSAQDIIVIRDPSMYAVTAQWLAEHSSLPIPSASGIFAGANGLSDVPLGFQPHVGGQAVDPQGNHLTQALTALVGAVAGQSALLKANAALGAVALLAFFGLARRFADGGWALVVTLALAVSLPMLHFSRAVFTEPLTLAMVVGGLSMLWRAQRSRRPLEAAAAGLTLGASALARIDGSVSLLFLVVLVALGLALAPKAQRLAELRWSVALLGGAAVPSVLGYVDLKRLAPGYARDLSVQLGLIEKAVTGLAVLSVVLVVLAWRTSLLERVLNLRWLPRVAAGTVVAYAVLLATRPLWIERHANLPAFYPSLAALQKALRESVDPSRSYDENTVTWLSWYFGWPALVMATVGLSVLAFRCVRDRDLTLLPLLLLVASVGTLYFSKASIFPDQIWAIRRFLPVVVPMLLIAAAYALALMWARRGVVRLVAGLLGVAVVALPLVTSLPLAGVRERVPQLAQVRSVCNLLPANAAVLMADEVAASQYAITLRSYCNVPTIGLVGPTAATLALARQQAASRGRTTWVLATKADQLPLGAGSPTAGTRTVVTKWQELLEGPPSEPHRFTTTLYLGEVSPDGTVQLSVLPAVGPPPPA